MSEFKPQQFSTPRSSVLHYQAIKVHRVRKRRNYAMIGGICIFLLYPCIIFARIGYDIVFHWDDGPDKMGFWLTLPCSLLPVLDQGDFAGCIAILMNAAFWAALWVFPALIMQSKVDGRPVLTNQPDRRPQTKRRRRQD